MTWTRLFSLASSFPALFCLGLLIRAPFLWSPIEEGQRNAQTACLTKTTLEDGMVRLDPVAPWRGDLNARLTQELPVYNLTVLALKKVVGFPLDQAGRITSLAFWVVSFIFLQALWHLCLEARCRPWANLLFILAPLNWYLSIAFMPESLIQFLSILFVLLVLRQASHPDAIGRLTLVFVAALGLLVKLPSFCHLGFFLFLCFLDRRGMRAWTDPVWLVGGIFLLGLLFGWTHYMESVNQTYFPYWTGESSLLGFIRPEVSRFGFVFWGPLLGYNLAFVLPVFLVPVATIGFLRIWKTRSDFYFSRIWLYLLLCLLSSWLIWGKGAAAQSYYNLPNLVCFSAFFGTGMAWIGSCHFFVNLSRFSSVLLRLAAVFLIFLWGAVGMYYLSRPDGPTLHAAEWVKNHTAPGDLILFQPLHSAAVMDYEHQPLLSHATGRRTWIWTRSTPDWEKKRALETSAYVVVTASAANSDFFEKIRRSFKEGPFPPPPSLPDQNPGAFQLVHQSSDFAIYRNLSAKRM